MRRLVVCVVAAAAVACGSDSKNSGSGGSSVTVAGTYAGSYSNGAGIVASGSCSTSGFNISGAAAIVGLSSSTANLCTAVTQGHEIANSTTIQISVAKLNAAGQAQITPDTYAIVDLSSGAPTTDKFAIVTASRSGASLGAGQGCAEVSSEEAASGTVTITSVSSTAIAGNLSVTLKNGHGTVNGSFSAPLCSGNFSLSSDCSAVSGIPSPNSCQ